MGREKSSKKYSTKNKLTVRMSAKKAKPGPKAHKFDMSVTMTPVSASSDASLSASSSAAQWAPVVKKILYST